MSDKAAPEESAGAALMRLVPLLLLTLFLCYNRPGQDPQYLVKGCGENLHKASVQIERARLTSEDKLYPRTLKEVYGKTDIPECPAANDDTYSEGYLVDGDQKGYVLVCKGTYHAKAAIPADYPRVGFSVAEYDAEWAKKTEEPSSSPSPAVSATPTVEASPASSPTPAASPSPEPTTEAEAEATPSSSATPAPTPEATSSPAS